MAIDISPAKMDEYWRFALEREQRERVALAARRERALALARAASELLKRDFGVRRLILFGSLAHGAWFHANSDIDLAVVGLAPDVFWQAWSAVDRLGPDFEINLVAVESASSRLRTEIERYGVEL